MKKLNLSKFDIGVIIAFVVIALLGGGAWWYLTGALQDAQADVATAKSEFDKDSSNPKYHVVVSPSNLKALQANIDMMRAQLDPLIHDKLQPKENKLESLPREDPVAWKADLLGNVNKLTVSAKQHGVTVPANFYYGFSRYISQSPGDEQTAVLSKQLTGIEELTNILINAKVKSIDAVRRTYEEDPRNTGNDVLPSTGSDQLPGYSVTVGANSYTAYPLEVEFQTDNSENLRTVIDSLIQSPYIFVVRTISIENSKPDSPMVSDLDKIAGTAASSVIESAPGEVASTTSTLGPQHFFGYETLKIKARIDLIEWTAELPEDTTQKPHSTNGGN